MQPKKERLILHCDCNCFFASVELLSYPQLKQVPVAVCGNPEDRHGIILAKNEAAKKFGVQTAETVWQALRKCPNLTLLPPHHKKYKEYSKIVNNIYARYTDRVEPFGIDESWLDITESCHLFADNAQQLADIIRHTVEKETGLTISVGVSFNKIFAKLGSDYKKPNATTVIMQKDVEKIVYPLPIEDMLYVGKQVKSELNSIGILTIGQLAAANPEMLANMLGKTGVLLSRYARGTDNDPVSLIGEQKPIKSIGNGITFKRNLKSTEDISMGVTALADSVATRLRKHGLWCSCVQITIKDTDLKTITRQKQLSLATNLAKDIKKAAIELIRANWGIQQPIRMLTITAKGLQQTESVYQLNLFEPNKKTNKKQENLENTMDMLRNKFGHNVIKQANIVNNDLGLNRINDEEDDAEADCYFKRKNNQ